jgi:bifunctional DNA-binding transcriptional regulator/antitoxin component of YhaV-PrlF toxin-antitoxin module
MEASMQTVRVRDKHQITLPMSIVRAAHIRENDRLSVSYKNGAIIFISETSEPVKRKSIMDYAGCMQDSYGKTADEVHTYLRNEQASWDK